MIATTLAIRALEGVDDMALPCFGANCVSKQKCESKQDLRAGTIHKPGRASALDWLVVQHLIRHLKCGLRRYVLLKPSFAEARPHQVAEARATLGKPAAAHPNERLQCR